jgi:hypothetical protein
VTVECSVRTRVEGWQWFEVTPKDATLAAVKRDRVNQRLIGQFIYTHVERSFYGVHFQHDTPRLNWTLMRAFPTRAVFQVDGWGL